MSLLALLLCTCTSVLLVFEAHADELQGGCVQSLQGWVAEQRTLFPTNRAADPDALLYFLHVPRTAGRTTNNCMLQPMTPPSRRCAKSYDGFKFNISMPNCGLFVSHDDFSAMRYLPKAAAVYTSLRDPVDRFLSAYEFATELGVREAVRPTNRKRPMNQFRVDTNDVWPWSHLKPLTLMDAKKKMLLREAERSRGSWQKVFSPDGKAYYFNAILNKTAWELSKEEEHRLEAEGGKVDPYDNPLYMPLQDFATHPLAYELLHNGQTLQVLGLTNYSHDPDAGILRQCIISDADAASVALDYAKERLRAFFHVSVFEKLRSGLSVLAAKLGRNLDTPAYRANKQHAFSYDAGDEVETMAEDIPTKDLLDESDLPKDAAETAKELRRVRQLTSQAGKELEDLRSATDQDATAGDEDKIAELEAKLEDLSGRRVRLEERQANLLADNTVSQNFAKCEGMSKQRSASKRRSIMSKLRTLHGFSAQFSSAAREEISEETIAFISMSNWMDAELHALAMSLANEAYEHEASKGDLKILEASKHPERRPKNDKEDEQKENLDPNEHDEL